MNIFDFMNIMMKAGLSLILLLSMPAQAGDRWDAYKKMHPGTLIKYYAMYKTGQKVAGIASNIADGNQARKLADSKAQARKKAAQQKTRNVAKKRVEKVKKGARLAWKYSPSKRGLMAAKGVAKAIKKSGK